MKIGRGSHCLLLRWSLWGRMLASVLSIVVLGRHGKMAWRRPGAQPKVVMGNLNLGQEAVLTPCPDPAWLSNHHHPATDFDWSCYVYEHIARHGKIYADNDLDNCRSCCDGV